MQSSSNTIVGPFAGYFNLSGSLNTYLGTSAGQNATGSNNVFLGSFAGRDETGSDKLYISNAIADANNALIYGEFDNKLLRFNADTLALGQVSIRPNDATSKHTMIEPLNTNGGVFLGEGAGTVNTANFNTFIGADAGFSNTTGSSNLFLGENTGRGNKEGSANTFVGPTAGYSNQAGILNTYVGAAAGQNATGSNNVFLGSNAGFSETGSDKLYISNSNADANNALIYGEFDNKLVRFNAGEVHIKSPGDAKIVLEADSDNINEDDNPQIEFSQDGGLVKTFLGYDQVNLGANLFGISSAQKDGILKVGEFGNVGVNSFDANVGLNVKSEAGDDFIFNAEDESGTNRLMVSLDGHVGVNAAYANSTLNVKAITGDITALNIEKANGDNLFSVFPSGNAVLLGSLTQSSDRTLKKNIVKISNAIESVQQLAGYRYNWISESSDQRTQIGVIAQEVQAVYPELVHENEEGILSVNYSGLSAILIEAVKEQESTITAQQAQIDQQEGTITAQQVQIDQLQQKLEDQTASVSELLTEMKEIRKVLNTSTASVDNKQ